MVPGETKDAVVDLKTTETPAMKPVCTNLPEYLDCILEFLPALSYFFYSVQRW